jgi:ADP-heptose:LPS heptosyltransferase
MTGVPLGAKTHQSSLLPAREMMSKVRGFVKNLALWGADRIAALAPIRQRRFGEPTAIYILMLKPLGLGDLMMLSPFFIEVARRFDTARTHLVTEYAQFMDLEGITWIHPAEFNILKHEGTLILSPTLSWKHLPFIRGAEWFLGYFFSNRMTSNFCRVTWLYDSRNGHYFERAERMLYVLESFRPGSAPLHYGSLRSAPATSVAVPKDYVCIAPYSNWSERQYPLDSYAAVIEAVVRKHPVVLVGGNHPDEVRMARTLTVDGVVSLVGKTNFAEAVDIIKRGSLFIGNDSGLAHAAFLANTPSVVVFGCVAGNQRMPIDSKLSDRIVALGAGNLCSRFPCYDGFNKPSCKNPDPYICLRGVTPDEVVGHALKMFDVDNLPTVS